ncbi:interferon-induced protein 44-like [Ruditapes philippinarum]|uniref:interferon-induced protein 44-like n=1 Tax=Ruditapes philippinarum TaxID=129788 RepID=UPI00295A76EB|nr:interferon-induced protein 44-like [Ruditapes philippinarum]
MNFGIHLGKGLTWWFPWREPDEGFCWTEDTEKKLKTEIEGIKPTERSGLTKLKALTIGACGHGKSALINSIASINAGYKTTVCNAAPSNETVTRVFRDIEFDDEFGQCVFGDISGLPLSTDIDPFLDDIKLIINGHIKSGYKFDPKKSISPENKEYYKETPSISDKIHCAIIVFDSRHWEEIHKSIIRNVKKIMETLHSMNIPVIAVLTKTDKLSAQVKYNVESIFRCKKTQQAVNKVAEQLAIPAPKVFPVVNFEERDHFTWRESIPILLFLRAYLRMAKEHAHHADEVVKKKI